MNSELKPCPVCSVMPERETRLEMLGTYRDGGYEVLHGRYKCPSCGLGPTWGQSYSAQYGWEANKRMWNRVVSNYLNSRAGEKEDT